MNDAYNVVLKKRRCYEEHDHLYLELTYEYETVSGKYELIIPKIELDIYAKRLPVINSEPFRMNARIITAKFGSRVYDLEMSRATITNSDGEIKPINDIYYVINTIEEKKHEITLEEIEKKLGYKVKIVSEKENNYD